MRKTIPENPSKKKKMEKAKNSEDKILQLRITLTGKKPKIWRRVLVPESFNLQQLHEVIQVTMGWENRHLYRFQAGKNTYGIPDALSGTSENPVLDARKTKFSELHSQDCMRCRYVYDLGDDWEHEIEIENTLPREKDESYPCFMEGERRCPPEDVGGIPGFEEFLKAISDRKHPEHDEMVSWVGGEYTPETLDAKAIAAGLARIAKRKKTKP